MKRLVYVALVIWFLIAPTLARGAADWNWQNYSNSALLSEGGDYTLPWYWWFTRRPSDKPYLLMNHKEKSWVSQTSGCAFNPNGAVGQKYTTTKNKVSYEYYVYSKVTLVAPVNVPNGTVVAQTKGLQITGGVSLCGVRYFPYGVPVKLTLP